MMEKRASMASMHRDQTNVLLLALLRLPKMGRKTARKLLEGQTQPFSLASILDGWREKTIEPMVLTEALDYAERTLEISTKHSVQTINYFSAEYPARLRSIDDPPLLLHAKGPLEKLSGPPAVAIIGTREPTNFGRASARRISGVVARSGALVVSGLAVGCDTEAHKGCLDADGTTVAVLAHGLDRVYPAENRSLSNAILEQSGCLVTEYEFGIRPFKTSFVERDRLQSGLSDAVLLIETGLKGGSLHTIGFALKQRRLIACVKHPAKYAHEEKVLGNIKLVSDGTAMPLETAADLQTFLEILSTVSKAGGPIDEPPDVATGIREGLSPTDSLHDAKGPGAGKVVVPEEERGIGDEEPRQMSLL